jgi:hypothetical protein
MPRSRIVALDQVQQFMAINLLMDQGLIAGPKLVDNCAEITLVWSLGSGKVGHIVLGGRYIAPFAGTAAQANAILAALTSGATWTTLAGFLSPQTSLHQVLIRNIHLADQPVISGAVTEHPGTSAGTDMPNEVALVIGLRTGLSGPRYRGRMYVPGWATNALGTTNLVAAGAVTALNAWAGGIQAALSASGYTWCLALPARNAYTSAVTGRVFPARPKETPAITQTVVDNHWDSQRRRGLK